MYSASNSFCLNSRLYDIPFENFRERKMTKKMLICCDYVVLSVSSCFLLRLLVMMVPSLYYSLWVGHPKSVGVRKKVKADAN